MPRALEIDTVTVTGPSPGSDRRIRRRSGKTVMSETTAGDAAAAARGGVAAAGSGASARQPEPPWRGPGDRKKRRPSGPLIALIGALTTGGIAAFAVWPGLSAGEPRGLAGDAEPSLSALAPSDIAPALETLDPATSKAAVDDAKSCKAPLAWVTLMKRPGSRGGLVRISSGSYLSPPIRLADDPQRLAIPYPAPYPVGRGVLSLVGDADDVWFRLTPGWFVRSLKGTASINVHWKPANPC